MTARQNLSPKATSTVLETRSQSLFLAFAKAFDKKFSGEKNHKVMMDWCAELFDKIKPQNLIDREKKLIAEQKKKTTDKKIDLITPHRFNQFNPVVYEILWDDFSIVLSTADTTQRKTEIIQLIGECYRQAVSLDFIEQHEKENTDFARNLEQNRMHAQGEKQENADKLSSTCEHIKQHIAKYSTHDEEIELGVHDTAFTYFTNRYRRHQQVNAEINADMDKLQIQIDCGELKPDALKIAKASVQDRINQLNFSIQSLNEFKIAESNDLSCFQQNAFNALQSEYNRLWMEISSDTEIFNAIIQEDQKATLIPSFTAKTITELFTIQAAWTEDAKREKKDHDAITDITTSQYSTTAAFFKAAINIALLGEWTTRTKPIWDELKDHLLKLHETWCKNTKQNINIISRANTIKQIREKLIAEQKADQSARFDDADESYIEAKKVSDDLKAKHEAFCQRINAEIRAKYLNIFKVNAKKQTSLLAECQQSHSRLKTIKISNVKKKAESAPKEIELDGGSREQSRPLLAHDQLDEGPKPQRRDRVSIAMPTATQTGAVATQPQTAQPMLRKTRLSALFGFLCSGGGAAAALLIPVPVVNLVVGGILAFCGLVSLIKSAYHYCQYRNASNSRPDPATGTVGEYEPPRHIAARKPNTEGRNQKDIRLKLSKTHPIAIKVREIGLDPDLGQVVNGGIAFSCRDNKRVLYFAPNGKVQLQQERVTSTLAEVTPAIIQQVRPEYRLA